MSNGTSYMLERVLNTPCIRVSLRTLLITFALCWFNPYVLCISESCIEMKIKFNFYFHTSLWCLKRFYEGLKLFFLFVRGWDVKLYYFIFSYLSNVSLKCLDSERENAFLICVSNTKYLASSMF